jgi:hypothetical protein
LYMTPSGASPEVTSLVGRQCERNETCNYSTENK